MRKQVDENANLDTDTGSSEEIMEKMIKEAEIEHQSMENYDNRNENKVDKSDTGTIRVTVPIHTLETGMDKVDTDGTWTINEQIMTSTSTDELMVPVLENNSGTGLNNDQYKLLSPSKQTIVDLAVQKIPVAELSITGTDIENTDIKKKKGGKAVKRANEEVNKEKTYDQAEGDHSLIKMRSDEESLSERTFKKARVAKDCNRAVLINCPKNAYVGPPTNINQNMVMDELPMDNTVA